MYHGQVIQKSATGIATSSPWQKMGSQPENILRSTRCSQCIRVLDWVVAGLSYFSQGCFYGNARLGLQGHSKEQGWSSARKHRLLTCFTVLFAVNKVE